MSASRERPIIRTAFPKDANTLRQLISDKAPMEQVNARLQLLTTRYSRLRELDDIIVSSMIEDVKMDPEAVEKEIEKAGEYSMTYLTLKGTVERLNEQLNEDRASVAAVSTIVARPSSNQLNIKMKREIRKFDGKVGNWIKFWSQFKQFHEDTSIQDDVKFDLLLQFIEPGSPADTLIENFPPSRENYAKAVDLLRSRFGKDEFLIEFYVREILALVLKSRDGGEVSGFYDTLEAQLRALESLGTTTDKYAAFLFPLVESAVPAEIFRTWERHRVEKGASMAEPSVCLAELMSFLRIEVESEERLKMRECSLGSPLSAFRQEKSRVSEGVSASTAASLVVGGSGSGKSEEKCVFCEKPHKNPQDCSQAAALTLEERMTVLRQKSACFRCLRRGHMGQGCSRMIKCVFCRGKHYPLICNKVSVKDKSNDDRDNSSKSDSAVTLTTSTFRGPTYLQTCRAMIVTPLGGCVVRILLDSGSQQSYITYKLAQKLKMVPTGKIELTQKLFGGKETAPKFHKMYTMDLKSIDGQFQETFRVIGQDCICDFQPQTADTDIARKLEEKGIVLTDCTDSMTLGAGEIDVLLGSDAWPKLITSQVVHVTPDLVAIRTTLGWTLLGAASEHVSVACGLVMTLTCQTHPSHFWDLEMMGILDPAEVRKQEEKDNAVIRFFKDTVCREESGRVVVRLPWIECRPAIDSNKNVAEQRLHATTRKLQRMGRLGEYDRVIQTWLEKGIIETIEESEEGLDTHYLPHRAVFKDSGTTKIRPVFDASTKDFNGISLNTLLETGPNLIELIPVSLINFRLFKVGVCADIESAFLQIAVASADRDMLRFLWWKDGKIVTLRHCRVVFGVSCSPFLLGAVLNYVFDNTTPEAQPLAEKLRKSFYVDNLLSGVDDESELDGFIESSKGMLLSAGFNLRSWADGVHNPDKIESVLGLNWHCGADLLECNLSRLEGIPIVITKRILLSVSQRIHDPIGFTAPVSLLPKLLYQEACEKNINWDETLPKELSEPFVDWANEIRYLEHCKIPRKLNVNDSSSLHVFCDASKRAYACCVFVRTEDEEGVKIGLVLAKIRVAPTRITSIPRLELMAALIGVRVMRLAMKGLRRPLPTHFWSDSAVVVDWIQGNGKWSVFVHNRVKEIAEFTKPSQWKHIPGAANPADLLSRGCSPTQLVDSKWWNGPAWLLLNPEEWPVSLEMPSSIEVDKERRKTTAVNCTILKRFSLAKNLAQLYSSYTKIVKKTTTILRFLSWRFKRFSSHCSGGVDGSKELDFFSSELTLFRAVQREYFSGDTKMDKLKNMAFFEDERGLLRLKTRVLEDECLANYQFPVILPAEHPLVVRLIEEEHRKNHAGVTTMIVTLRERHWLLRGRQVIAKVVRRCAVCQRYRVKPLEVPYPPLPKDRTNVLGTFQTTGLDLAGPLYLADGRKAWVVIFTCAVFRAVHLELVLSLSSEDLVQALRRFIARRGRPSTLYSDNGTNFIGLENELERLDWQKVRDECDLQRIKWKFNVPTGAWWGGFWERLIRILKDLLRKNLGRALVDYVEMSTLLCDCEAVMNLRPLTYVNEDPNELAPLTPSMFMTSVPNSDVADLDTIESGSPKSRFRYLQELRQGLRTRFKREYLGFLRTTGNKRTDLVAIGDIVLVESEKKRVNWIMAKVIEIFPGRDGINRVARLKTANGELIRPLQRLYPLEINDAPSTEHTEEQVNQGNEETTNSASSETDVALEGSEEEEPFEDNVQETEPGEVMEDDDVISSSAEAESIPVPVVQPRSWLLNILIFIVRFG